MSIFNAKKGSLWLLLVASFLASGCQAKRIIIPPDPSATAMPATDQLVTAHNRWRAQVNVPPLSWSNTLQQQAQGWANQLKTNNQCNMRHSAANGKTGENIFWASPLTQTSRNRPPQLSLQKVSAERVVNAWGSEVTDYDYQNNRCASGKICGHYTQMVWRSSREVGCAKAICADLSQVWVCNYAPAGNWRGERPY